MSALDCRMRSGVGKGGGELEVESTQPRDEPITI